MILYHIWVIVYGKNLYIVAQLIETKWLNIIHKTEGLKKQSMVKINHLPKEIHCSIDHGQKHHAKNWTLILAEPSKHHQLILFPKTKANPIMVKIQTCTASISRRWATVTSAGPQQDALAKENISQGWFCLQQHKRWER